MRLIDADAIKPSIFDTYDLKAMLDKQPTAYDIDKVIEQLQRQVEQYRRRAEEAKQRGYNSESYHNYGKACSYEHALEIVRGE